MNNVYSISVVMAIRNAEATLQQATESLLAQTLPAREILLILNGCSDDSFTVAQGLARAHPSIRLLSSDREGGVALAAQVGCEQANSPLIARMDADDIAHPERLEQQVGHLQTTRADLVTCRIEPLASLGAGLDRFVDWANTLREPRDFQRGRFIESPVVQPGVLMTKKAYLRAGGYRVEEGPEDYDLWLRMLALGGRFFQAPGARLWWRDSATRLTRCHSDYSEACMTATKARYLARVSGIQTGGVVLAGTGPIGRRLARQLAGQHIEVKGFFDVSPQKIGRTVLGLPVWGPDDLGAVARDAVLLGCVGRGGRPRIRKLALDAGYREGEDFFGCC